jgi:Tfp pilus assembly protein PilF
LIITEVARGFSRTPTGEVATVPARHIDLLPTILDAIGQPVPADLPGRSLLPSAERTAGAAARPSYFEAMSGMLNRGTAPLTGVLVGREKFIELPIAERYDLASDAGERVNIAGRSPERDRTLLNVLHGYAAAWPGARAAESADAAERLRTLGYASGSAAPKQRYTEADDPKQIVELDASMHRAVEAAGAGRIAAAIQIYQQIIARRPDFAIAYRHLACLESQRGNLNDAIAVLQRATAAGVTQPALVAQLGGYLADGGRLAQGIQLLEPVAADPRSSRGYSGLGVVAARAGDRRSAIDAWSRAVELDRTNFDALYNLATALVRDGQRERARPYIDAFLKTAPPAYDNDKRELERLSPGR